MEKTRRTRILLLLVLLEGGGSVLGCSGEDCSPNSGVKATLDGLPRVCLYSVDPNHPWNQIHSAANTWQARRTGKQVFSSDWLGIPEDPEYLSGLSQDAALCLLASLAEGGEGETRDPLKRCLFQSTLWLLFDWAVDNGRAAWADRLVTVMKRIALSAEEIRALPDNYALAVASGTFPGEFEEEHPKRSFLPRDLEAEDGPWIVLGDGENDSNFPLARLHVGFFEGRSTFLVLFRTPGNRESGVDYLRKLTSKGPGDVRVQGFLKGTEVALWRRLMTIDRDGRIVQTPITESLQIRVYDYAHLETLGIQEFFKVVLHRGQLLAGQAGGLVPVTDSSLEPSHLVFLGTVPTERAESALTLQNTLGSCAGCHMASGPNGVSLESYARVAIRNVARPDLRGISRRAEELRTARWKTRSSSFQELERLWEKSP